MHFSSGPIGEFELIERFFKLGANAMNPKPAIGLGIGDDCALIHSSPNEEIAITTDMLVEGRHFFVGANPELLGRKALAVNLSDLAAIGATPFGFTLALALPRADPVWLASFSQGLFSVAREFACSLIGGDTTAGPLTISITAFGSLPKGEALLRSGAKPGEDIWVSGELGGARLALAALRHEIELTPNELQHIEQRMHQPTPRVELGTHLRGIASSALDISDGLLGDLKHILNQSKVDAQIWIDQLPKPAILLTQAPSIQNQFAACGGDDYEICFTAAKPQRAALEKISQTLNLPLTRIGQTVAMKNNVAHIELYTSHGIELGADETKVLMKSFDHFK
jgi:thiamine-monophosphate kinase